MPAHLDFDLDRLDDDLKYFAELLAKPDLRGEFLNVDLRNNPNVFPRCRWWELCSRCAREADKILGEAAAKYSAGLRAETGGESYKSRLIDAPAIRRKTSSLQCGCLTVDVRRARREARDRSGRSLGASYSSRMKRSFISLDPCRRYPDWGSAPAPGQERGDGATVVLRLVGLVVELMLPSPEIGDLGQGESLADDVAVVAVGEDL